MPNVTLSLSARFLADANECPLHTAIHARKLLPSLVRFPDMGRVAESPTLVSRFGEGVRTLVCDSYLLVYSHEDGVVTALSLYPARLVR